MPYPTVTSAEAKLAREIARRIQQGMDEKDWNQTDLARAVKCTQGTVSDLLSETKHRIPLGIYLIRMAQVFGFNLEWFVFGVGEPHRSNSHEPPQAYYVRGELAAVAKMEQALGAIRTATLSQNDALSADATVRAARRARGA